METNTTFKHMKSLSVKLILLFFLSVAFKMNGQVYRQIPDSSFRYYIANDLGLASIMSGDSLDISSPALTLVSTIACGSPGWGVKASIVNLEGVQYFTNCVSLDCSDGIVANIPALPALLTTFYCSNNLLTSLPAVPSSLVNFGCIGNMITSLPSLPGGLKVLSCGQNNISVLPILPSTLTKLYCGNNSLSALPVLPAGLTEIICDTNFITSLPTLPDSLRYISCKYNPLVSLPAMPSKVAGIYCDGCSLINLPALPSSLIALTCSYNSLSALPALPSQIVNLECNSNSILSLPALPNSLRYLYCMSNLLNSLPSLSTSLEYIFLDNNFITTLPSLPSTLTAISCQNNLISSLPIFPGAMRVADFKSNLLTTISASSYPSESFNCSYNQITNLPSLASSSLAIDCSHNLITTLPNSMNVVSIDFGNNPVNCLDFLVNWDLSTGLSIYYDSTGIVCVPPLPPNIADFHPIYSTYPLCDEITNSNGCSVIAKSIKGHVFIDMNNNCIRDAGDVDMKNRFIRNLTDGYSTFSTDSNYLLHRLTDTIMIYIANIDTSLDNLCSSNDTLILNFDNSSSQDTNGIDFAYYASRICSSPIVFSYSNSFPRRCSTMTYNIIFGNDNIDTIINPYLEVEVDTINLSLFSSSSPFVKVGNKLIFNVEDIGPFEYKTITYTAFLSCTSAIGINTCNSVNFYPIGNCGSSAGYDSTKLELIAECNNDTISLRIKNSSAFDMATYGLVNIYEDEIIQISDTFRLNAGVEYVTRHTTGANKTWTAIVHQNPHHPTQPIIIKHDDLCTFSGLIKSNVVIPHFSRYDESSEYEENCATIQGSCDPNQKSVVPEGMYEEHYTSPGQILNYRIDFQNVGTDTAFRVLIDDTLSSELNLATIIPGGSSHPYAISMQPNNRILFIFDPIALPDSNASVPNSQGYVTFKIKAKADIAPKTVINNFADIYFDMNSPVRTNTVFNTMYDTVEINLINGIEDIQNNEAKVLVFPNPASQIFYLNFNEVVTQMDIYLIDINGREVLSEKMINAQQKQIDISKLSKGIYFINCLQNGILLAKKKIIIQ